MAGTWLTPLLLAGLLGMVGQGIRVVMGLKKLHDLAQLQQQKVSDMMSGQRVWLSLLIGFIAGVLGFLAMGLNPATVLDQQHLLTLITVGYAGTDAIEAVMSKAQPAWLARQDDGTHITTIAATAVTTPVPAVPATRSEG
ncbi:hypothetical protein [Chitinimonas lacunae]|uniref:Holin n=1 Tax=Chitinimonas lacunae TaxID=1963018 RepID=A0ABV8MT59_9NEIS